MEYNKELNTLKVVDLNKIIKENKITDAKNKEGKITNIIKFFTESNALTKLDSYLKETPKKEEKKGAGYFFVYKINGFIKTGKTIIKNEEKLKEIIEKKLGCKPTAANYNAILTNDVSAEEKKFKEKYAEFITEKGYSFPKEKNIVLKNIF